MWAIVTHLPTTMKYGVLLSLCFLSFASASFDRGRHRTPIRKPNYPRPQGLGSPRSIQQIQKQDNKRLRKPVNPFLFRLPSGIIPLRGLFSFVDSRSRSQRIPNRQIFLTKKTKKQKLCYWHSSSSFNQRFLKQKFAKVQNSYCSAWAKLNIKIELHPPTSNHHTQTFR